MTEIDGRSLRASQHAPGGGEIVWAEPTARRVRVFVGGAVIADSNEVLVLYNGPRVPAYYFPRQDVRVDLLEVSEHCDADPRLGERSYATVVVGEHRAENALFAYREPIADGPDLSRHVSFVWDAVDAWFEEDEQIFRHPRDPYKRVDVVHSSRHVRILVDGQVVANSHRPMLLFETALPTRYYLPKLDVRMELLTPTDTRSRCPYKGEAVYWNLDVGGHHLDDVVWSYPAPLPEIPKIENLLAFYNEKVDIEVDGVVQQRPRTSWS